MEVISSIKVEQNCHVNNEDNFPIALGKIKTEGNEFDFAEFKVNR